MFQLKEQFSVTIIVLFGFFGAHCESDDITWVRGCLGATNHHFQMPAFITDVWVKFLDKHLNSTQARAFRHSQEEEENCLGILGDFPVPRPLKDYILSQAQGKNKEQQQVQRGGINEQRYGREIASVTIPVAKIKQLKKHLTSLLRSGKRRATHGTWPEQRTQAGQRPIQLILLLPRKRHVHN